MRCTDHLPLVPDIGNYLFGGSSSDQAITLGGVTPDGEDAVYDMTYIFLKVTEMLCIRDPNVNARFHPGEEQRGLPEAALRGEPDHHGHAVPAQRHRGDGLAGGIQLRHPRTCATGPPPGAWSPPFRASTSATPTA